MPHLPGPGEGLGAVFDEQETVVFGETDDRAQVHPPAEEVRHEHDPRPVRARSFQAPDRRRQGPGIEIHGNDPQPVPTRDAGHVRVRDR